MVGSMLVDRRATSSTTDRLFLAAWGLVHRSTGGGGSHQSTKVFGHTHFGYDLEAFGIM